jgi:hypothetical protein
MIFKRLIGSASVAGVMAMALAGSATAADVTLGTTGPDSNQEVNVQNENKVETTNDNNIQVVNASSQQATTGDVKADNNTTAGGTLGSGNASNNNAANTTVSIGNESATVGNGNGGEQPGSGGSNGGSNGCNCNAGGIGASNPGKGGSVLGASTVPGMGAGVETLPVTGATVPVDVSALRAAWHPNSAAAKTLVNQSQAISQWMLALAALLSLVGAFASVIYARRQEGRS